MTILRNVAANWTGYAVQIGVAFFLTPFVLHSLGDARYGVWSIIVGLTGYYGLVDLGFRSGLTQYLARYLAVRDYDRMNEVASTGFMFLFGSAALVAVASVGAAWAAPRVWHISPALVRESQLAILISGIGFAAQFMFFVYSAVFQATQRFDLANVIGVGTRLANAGLTVALLKTGYGLPALAAATAATSLLDYGLRVPVARRILPQLKLRRTFVRVGLWRQFAVFGLASMLTQGGTRLITYSDAMVIGFFMPVAAIAPFSLAAGLVAQFSGLFGPIGWVLCPTLTWFDAAGDRDGLQRVLVSAARWMTLAVVVTAVIIGAVARDFFGLWVGASYSDSNPFGSVTTIFLILLVGAAASASQRVTVQIFYAVIRPNLLASLVVTEAISNLVLSVALIRPLGLIGVAIGTLVPAIVFNGLVVPAVACRMVGIAPARFLRHTALRPLVSGAVLLPIVWSISRHIGSPSWLLFFAKSVALVTIGLGVAIVVGMSGGDRAHAVQLTRELSSRLRGRAKAC